MKPNMFEGKTLLEILAVEYKDFLGDLYRNTKEGKSAFFQAQDIQQDVFMCYDVVELRRFSFLLRSAMNKVYRGDKYLKKRQECEKKFEELLYLLRD